MRDYIIHVLYTNGAEGKYPAKGEYDVNEYIKNRIKDGIFRFTADNGKIFFIPLRNVISLSVDCK